VSSGTDEKIIHENIIKATFSWLCPLSCAALGEEAIPTFFTKQKGKADIVFFTMPVFLW
jgi:hypothetical protein